MTNGKCEVKKHRTNGNFRVTLATGDHTGWKIAESTVHRMSFQVSLPH